MRLLRTYEGSTNIVGYVREHLDQSFHIPLQSLGRI